MNLTERIEAARRPILSDAVFTGGARDMLRISGFAGFDVKEVMLKCFQRRARTPHARINARTVENAMGQLAEEWDREHA